MLSVFAKKHKIFKVSSTNVAKRLVQHRGVFRTCQTSVMEIIKKIRKRMCEKKFLDAAKISNHRLEKITSVTNFMYA